jgi:acyl-CoA synthetase (NDP forming)
MLGSQPLPRGRRVGIVTNAGGPGILCTDTCEANGLLVPELSRRAQERLARFLPPAASFANPVDMIASASPDQYRQTIETILKSNEIDALIVIYIPVMSEHLPGMTQAIREGITTARGKGGADRPVLACLMTGQEPNTPLVLPNENVPTYRFPEAAARILGKVAPYAEWRRESPGVIPTMEDIDPSEARRICRTAIQQRGDGWLTPVETRAVLETMNLPLPEGGVASTANEAADLAEKVGFPVAVKLASHKLVHKTEIGGVFLNLNDKSAVRKAFKKIRDRLDRDNRLDAMEGVLVQSMLSGGVEVMVGVTEDPLFGPLIAFGLGGIHVEVLSDVCFRITPVTDKDAGEMIRSIRGFRLLQGYRGHPAADIDALESVVLRVSRLVEEVTEIQDLDLNPIFALPPGEGCSIVDARIRVGAAQPGQPHRYATTPDTRSRKKN